MTKKEDFNQIDMNNVRTGSKQVCISMSISDWLFTKRAGFSPTRLLRKAVNGLRRDRQKEDIDELFGRLKATQKIIEQYANFTEQMQNCEKFSEFQDNWNNQELMANKKKKLEDNTKKAEAEVAEVLRENGE